MACSGDQVRAKFCFPVPLSHCNEFQFLFASVVEVQANNHM